MKIGNIQGAGNWQLHNGKDSLIERGGLQMADINFLKE